MSEILIRSALFTKTISRNDVMVDAISKTFEKLDLIYQLNFLQGTADAN